MGLDLTLIRLALLRRRTPIYLHARDIGISEYRLRRILAGRVELRPGELERIIKPLGLTVKDLAAPGSRAA
jgi:hypothetical protein